MDKPNAEKYKNCLIAFFILCWLCILAIFGYCLCKDPSLFDFSDFFVLAVCCWEFGLLSSDFVESFLMKIFGKSIEEVKAEL